jgi:hypothetical protein
MKLSLIARNLEKYDEEGKGYGRVYLYGDRVEITALRDFIDRHRVNNADPDISFTDFFNYLEDSCKGHSFSASEIRLPGNHSCMTYIFNSWIAELTEDQKINIRDRVIKCHQQHSEGRAHAYGYGSGFFARVGAYFESSSSSSSSNNSGAWFGSGMRF